MCYYWDIALIYVQRTWTFCSKKDLYKFPMNNIFTGVNIWGFDNSSSHKRHFKKGL